MATKRQSPTGLYNEVRLVLLLGLILLMAFKATGGFIFLLSGWVMYMATKDLVDKLTGGKGWALIVFSLTLTVTVLLIPIPIGLIVYLEAQHTYEGFVQNSEVFREMAEGIVAFLKDRAPGLFEKAVHDSDVVAKNDTDLLMATLGGRMFDNAQSFMGGLGKVLVLMGKGYIEVIIWVIYVTLLYAKGDYLKAHVRPVFHTGLVRAPSSRDWLFAYYGALEEVLGHWIRGWFKIIAIFTVVYFLIYALGPWGFTISKSIALAVVTGIITSIFMKVGGMASATIAGALTLTQFQQGFMWFGFDLGTTGELHTDILLRTALIWGVVKLFGLAEPIIISPKIIGDVLGIPVAFMVSVIMGSVMGAGLGAMFAFIFLMLLYWAHHVLCEREIGEDPLEKAVMRVQEELQVR